MSKQTMKAPRSAPPPSGALRVSRQPATAPPVMRGADLPDPDRPDLAVPLLEPPLRVVLVEPRIPPNVGAVSRLCAALGAPLVLVGRMTFREDHPARRRAGMDYWDRVEKVYVPDVEAALRAYPDGALHLFSTRSGVGLYERVFSPGDLLVFGSEDSGLPSEILEAHPAACVRIPMVSGVRSLNLSSSVAIAAFEAMRQIAFSSEGLG